MQSNLCIFGSPLPLCSYCSFMERFRVQGGVAGQHKRVGCHAGGAVTLPCPQVHSKPDTALALYTEGPRVPSWASSGRVGEDLWPESLESSARVDKTDPPGFTCSFPCNYSFFIHHKLEVGVIRLLPRFQRSKSSSPVIQICDSRADCVPMCTQILEARGIKNHVNLFPK